MEQGTKKACWGCNKRKPGCHGDCPAYQAAAAERERLRKLRYSEKELEAAAFDSRRRMQHIRGRFRA